MRNVISLEQIEWVQKGKKIIDNLSWQVRKGEHWVILGLNGSGKTSLLNMIVGYKWPTKGTIHVFGQRFGQTNIPELRKSIGWVSSHLDEQFMFRVQESALDIVISGKFSSIGLYEDVFEKDRAFALTILDELKIAHLANQPFTHLSQGEKRRVVIARAMMARPKLIILDEPCNGLDIYAKEQLLESIQDITMKEDGPTVLYVTHHIEEIVPGITHALLLHNGKMVSNGEKKRTLTSTLLEKTFQVPVAIRWEEERPWLSINYHKKSI